MRFATIVICLGVVCGCGSNAVEPAKVSTSVTGSGPSTNTIVPTITTISPASAVVGTSDFTLTVRGANFVNEIQTPSWVRWAANGVNTDLWSTVVSDSELTVRIPASLLAIVGTASLLVVNGDSRDGYDGPKSNIVEFKITATADPVAVYSATFTASPACASVLPLDARERTYTATLRSGGTIDWSGPTLNPPPGHRPISSGVLSNSALSFSIDVERDPQSDDFHGLWDDFGSGKILNIAGKGSGLVHEAEITGTLDGLFAFYEPVNPPQPNVLVTGVYCRATDHQFRFVKQ